MILTENSDKYIYSKNSSIHGSGLFIKENVLANTLLLKLTGKRIHHEYTPEFALTNPNWIGIGYQEWIIPRKNNKTLYLNHSCSPNVIFNKTHYLVAIRTIKENEELLLDYSTTELDPFWSMACACRSPHCRKKILPFQQLPYDLRLKYKAYLADIFWEAASVNKTGAI
jgi:hypothetical protein